jgi:hypothetical protein
MYSDILFLDDNARMARGWLDFADHFFHWSCVYMREGKFDSAVTHLDFCLDMYENYKYHPAKLGLPVPPEQEGSTQSQGCMICL